MAEERVPFAELPSRLDGMLAKVRPWILGALPAPMADSSPDHLLGRNMVMNESSA